VLINPNQIELKKYFGLIGEYNMKYISSILFILATACLAWHEALSTVSKHGNIDLISTWQWHISQWLVVLLYTGSGIAFGQWYARGFLIGMLTHSNIYVYDWREIGCITVAGLAPALVLYQFLYPYLCGVVK
jgi:hypothetical protein